MYGYRMMDRAWLRDGEVIHTGEALLLAVLLHSKGKSRANFEDTKYVAKLMKDPNRKNPRR